METTKINNNIISLFFLFFILLSSFLVAQSNKLESEILVYFLPDSLEMSEGGTTLNDITKLKIKSKSLNAVMSKIKLKSIKKAFPNFNKSDMIRTCTDGRKITLPNMSRIFKLKFKNKKHVKKAIRLLSKEKGVLFAEKHSNMQLHTNDSRYSEQWNLNNTGQEGGTVDADIDAPEAWSVFTGSSNVKLGVIDTGVNTDHEDLNGKSSGDLYESYPSGYEHGTHVAGISGAIHGNNGKVKGVDANVKIISRKVFSGYYFSYKTGKDEPKWGGDDNAYNKIVSAVNSGANVLNNSWGGPDYSSVIRMAFAYAYKNDVVSVVSMGNSGNSTTHYPAAYEQGIIAVGATDRNDDRSGFSSYGDHIDVSAPGSNILSTLLNDSYGNLSGTSMAAPHVSGIASLLKGYKSYLDNDDIENIIKISADDVNSNSYPGWDQYLGTGRVNARKALDLLRSPYVLNHKSANGGSVFSSTNSYGITFYGVSGLADGYYIVKRYEVRKSVSFGYTTDTHVWGRGVGTNGFSNESPNYGMGFCDVVSHNSSSATLRTYVYKVWNVIGQYLGYYPTTPSNVHFEYTVLGKNEPLSVYITGPSYLNGGQTGTWTAHPSGGRTPYHYHWEYYVFCDEPLYNSDDINPNSVPCGHWFNFGGDSQTASRSDWKSFKVKVTVTDANNSTAVAYKTVSVASNSPQLAKNNDKKNMGIELPKKTELFSNFPNPFNPTTTISYQIPKAGNVQIKVYDVLGKEVALLVNEQKEPGRYTVQFDASNLPSGFYFYRMQAGKFSDVRKMLLMK